MRPEPLSQLRATEPAAAPAINVQEEANKARYKYQYRAYQCIQCQVFGYFLDDVPQVCWCCQTNEHLRPR